MNARPLWVSGAIVVCSFGLACSSAGKGSGFAAGGDAGNDGGLLVGPDGGVAFGDGAGGDGSGGDPRSPVPWAALRAGVTL